MPSYVTWDNMGPVVAWGDDYNGQVTGVPTGTDFVDLLPGGAFQSVAIRRDRTLELWGAKQITDPSRRVSNISLPGVRFVDAAIGVTHMVAIREDDRTLVAAGTYPGGIACTPPVSTRPFVAVAAAGAHDIAIDDDGKLYPWGPAPVAAAAVPAGEFRRVRARNDYILALDKDGRLFGWGGVFDKTLDPQLWDGWQSDNLGHWFIDGPFMDMDAGIVQDFVHNGATMKMPHVLALYRDSKTVAGWGANNFGEANAPGGEFQAIAAGKGYSLGLDKNGFLQEWGSPLRPAATTVNNSDKPPRHWKPSGRFIAISAAGDHAVAVRYPRHVVGPDYDQTTLKQPSLELSVPRVNRELSDALRIVRDAVTGWRQGASGNPEESARRDQQSEQFERLANRLVPDVQG